MENSDEESRDDTRSLMEEALKILSQEGFRLPDDVVDTLHTVGRSNATARRRGSLRGHRVCEVQSNHRRMRNDREASGSRRNGSSSFDETKENGEAEAASTETSERRFRRYERDESDDVFSAPSTAGSAPRGDDQTDFRPRGKLERAESGESSSTCSASTVREAGGAVGLPASSRPQYDRQDSGSSIASSASSLNKKHAGQGRHESGSDTGYHTSLENALQTHEARAENLKNFNKQIDSKLPQRKTGLLRRDISRDSGFTESGFSTMSPGPSTPVATEPESRIRQANTSTTHDFNDFSVSNSDVSERSISTDAGDAHTVTSTAGDMKAAEMTSRSDEVTEDGTAVSSVAKLQNQESNSTMLRVTNKNTQDTVSKQDDYESVNKTSKSSRNDSISTTESGVTTAASRHAASVEQGLYKESTKMSTGKDGQSASSEMNVDQQLARNQQVNNIEQSDDGASKEETKRVSEKALTSKSHKEERLGTDDGPLSGTLSSTQNLDSKAKTSLNEEVITQADGTVVKRSNDSTSKTENEEKSSEQKTVKRNPYGGGLSTELVKKTDNSAISEFSKKLSESKETPTGRSTYEVEEDDKTVSSNFSGQCESTEERDGLKLHRTTSSEKSSTSSVKSSRSVSSYSSRNNTGEIPGENSSANRRLSNISDVSNVTNLSGLSRDNIHPPSYEETISNKGRSRQGSMSSVLSRQDSDTSSIASSASAFNERQRQKMLNKGAMERQDSGETYRKEVGGYNSTGRGYSSRGTRQDSFSSDSTIGGDFEEDISRRSGVINHPIKLADSASYTRRDTSMTKPVNRRATLQSDIVLTERDLNVARSDIRSNLGGRDDLLNRSEYSSRSTRAGSRRYDDDFGFRTTSFKDEVMGIVDRFFDDDDDDFGIGFGRRRTGRDRNPYSTKEDLSTCINDSFDSLSGHLAEPEYAASESGYPVTRGRYGSSTTRSRYDHDDIDFSDSVSESGYNARYGGRTRTGVRDVTDYDTYGSSRTTGVRPYESAHYAEQATFNEVSGDGRRSAGKSIQNDRQSMGVRSRQNEMLESNIRDNNAVDSSRRCDDDDYSSYKTGSSRYSGAYSKHTDMNVNRDYSSYNTRKSREPTDSKVDNYRSRTGHESGHSSDKRHVSHQNGEEEDEDKKQRIGKALSWIKSELGVLRTQDKVLMSQFQRCQDSIEELKKQRPWYEVYSDDEEDEDRYWEDGEIEDFDRADRKGLGSRSHSNAEDKNKE